MSIKTNNILITALNFLLFLAMVTVNGLANGLPINGVTTGQLSAMYPNLFVPAGITFSIWGLIYLLLLLMVVFQFYAAIKNDNTLLLPLKAQFVLGLNFLFNAVWIFLWHYKLVFLSLLLMLGLLASLIYLFLQIKTLPQKPLYALAVRIPVSIYFGWISVATIANVTALLVSLNWGAWGLSENIWTIVVMAVAAILALLMLHKYGCFMYALVIVWAYTGIITKRTAQTVVEKDIVLAAYLAIAVIVIYSVLKVVMVLKASKT
jgi:hypothetical protein